MEHEQGTVIDLTDPDDDFHYPGTQTPLGDDDFVNRMLPPLSDSDSDSEVEGVGQDRFLREKATRVTTGQSVTLHPKGGGTEKVAFMKPGSRVSVREGILQCTLSVNEGKLAVLCESGMLVECFFYNSAWRPLAVCMGLHPRLGKASLLSAMDPLLLEMILSFVHFEPLEDIVHETCPDDKLHALSYCSGNQLRVWKNATVHELQNASVQPDFCSHNKKIAAGINGLVFILDENYLLEKRAGTEEVGEQVFPSWSSDGSRLAITGLRGAGEIEGVPLSHRTPPLLWDASTLTSQLPLQPFLAAERAVEDLQRQASWGCMDLVSYCPTRQLIAVSYKDGHLRLFEWKSDPPNGDVWTLMGAVLVGRGQRLQRMSWDPSGRFVVGLWRHKLLSKRRGHADDGEPDIVFDLTGDADGCVCVVFGFRIDPTGTPSLCGQYRLPNTTAEPADAFVLAAGPGPRCTAAVALRSIACSGKSQVRILPFPQDGWGERRRSSRQNGEGGLGPGGDGP